MNQGVFQVFVLRNGVFLGTEMVPGAAFSVGTGPENEVCLQGPPTLGTLLCIELHGAEVWISHAAAGVTLNGQPWVAPCAITPRDDVQVHGHGLKVKHLVPQVAPLEEPLVVPPPRLPVLPPQPAVDALLAFFDEEDEAHDDPPAFSMDQHLAAEVRFTGSTTMAEVFSLNGTTVTAYQPLKRGASVGLGANARLQHLRSGELQVTNAAAPWRGTLRRNGEDVDLGTHWTPGHTLTLRLGESATLVTERGTFLVRLSNAPATLAEVLRGALVHAAEHRNTQRLVAWSVGASLCSHLLMLLGAWVMDLRNPHMVAHPLEEEFAPRVAHTLCLEDPTPPAPIRQNTPAVKSTPSPRAHAPAATRNSARPTNPARTQLAALDQFLGKSQSVAKAAIAAAAGATKAAPSSTHGFRTSSYASAGPSQPLGFGDHAGITPHGLNYYARKGDPGGLGRREKSSVRGGLSEAVHRMGLIRPETDHKALGSDEIAKVVNKHMGEISYCYETALLQNPGLAGRARVEWTVGPSGNVLQVRSMQNEVGPAMNCILDRIRAWSFPPLPAGKTIVNYPFVFRATS